MLNQFIATCNVAFWSMSLEFALFVCLPLHHAAPHHWSVLEYLTSVPLTPFTDMSGCGRLSTDCCRRGWQNVLVRTSLLHPLPQELGSAAQADYGPDDFNTPTHPHTHSRQLICYLLTSTCYTQEALNLSIMTHHIFKRTQVDPLYLSENLIV